RRPTAHEYLMTDVPNTAAVPAANTSTPDGETRAGDPELAALVAGGVSAARPRRRRSLALRFGASFVVAFVLAMGIGTGVMYAWGRQIVCMILLGGLAGCE